MEGLLPVLVLFLVLGILVFGGIAYALYSNSKQDKERFFLSQKAACVQCTKCDAHFGGQRSPSGQKYCSCGGRLAYQKCPQCEFCSSNKETFCPTHGVQTTEKVLWNG